MSWYWTERVGHVVNVNVNVMADFAGALRMSLARLLGYGRTSFPRNRARRYLGVAGKQEESTDIETEAEEEQQQSRLSEGCRRCHEETTFNGR